MQHDNTNYTASFYSGRANLSSVKRFDVTNISLFTSSTMNYNTAGSTLTAIDLLGHTSSLSYADNFSDGNNGRNTLAYPTTATDADSFSSTAQYNFDFGAVTRTQSPPPAGQSVGAIKHFTYDSQARLEKAAIEFGGNADYSHTRYEYPTSQNRVDTYATIQAGLGEAHSFQIVDGYGRGIASASDHPGSTGGFSGQTVFYDRLGRAIKTSNPTETSASGTPSQWSATGDDATAGWLYTQQTYDWKGRPLVTTNPNDTTKEASYAGCGCAGGAVTTLTDEGTIDGGVAKRRQQKIYADVLGHTVKTEELNWQGGSVYSTSVNTLNARDQVTLVRLYQGTETSNVYQDATMTYDGYGRLKTKHVPEQNANTATTYYYHDDDTPSSVVDARGASQTFSYNARRLVTGIAYTAPAGIPASPDVSFAYDAGGNRTSMSDGMGSVSYQYNQLSQMISEARTFSDADNSSINGVTKTISYDYNLGAELKSITDPAGATINYDFDATGRLSAVTGSSFGGVTTYASGAQYRAWGVPKHLSYGNSKTLDATYNARLQAATFNIPGVMSKAYDYNADGQLRFSSDLLDHRFDRSYSQDHLGRLKEAFSGAEARGETATNDRPYKETFAYDGLNHLTSRQTTNWSDSYSMTDSYTNNRRDDWDYDAEGNLFGSPDTAYTYDAAGEIRTAGTYEPQSTTTRGLDGDGRQVRTAEVTFNEASESWVTTRMYYLHSTVLGGQVLTELAADGAKMRTFVYAGGTVLAWQKFYGTGQSVEWEHRDASNASFRTSNVSGVWDSAELDATNADAGTHAPLIFPNPPDENSGSLVPYPSFMDAHSGLTRTYRSDGVAVSVDYFMRALDDRFHGSFIDMSQFLARKAALTLRNYEVDFGNGESADYGLDKQAAELKWRSGGGEWTLVRNFGVNDSWSFAFAWLPQNTAPNENAIRNGLNKALSNPDCKALVDALLNAVATKKNPLVTQYGQGGIMGMFEAVMLEDGLTRTPVPGSAGYGSATGNIAQGDAQIFVESRPFGPADQLQADTKGVLGELIHLGGQKKVYTDRAFAVIVHRDYPGLTTSIWPGNPNYKLRKDAKENPNHIGWSYYWHQAVNRKCF